MTEASANDKSPSRISLDGREAHWGVRREGSSHRGFRQRARMDWRNRVAHHDSLLRQDLECRLAEMISVARAIDPACGEWLLAETEMPTLLKRRPGV